MTFAVSMLVVAFMSLPPKSRKRGRPEWTDPALWFKMQVSGCGPFSRLGVRRWRNTKSGAASPQLGETTPLVGAYSIVRSVAAQGAAQCATAPRFGQRALGYRRFTGCSNRPEDAGEPTMIVVAVNHLLNVIVAFAVVADVVPVVNPVNVVGNGTGD